MKKNRLKLCLLTGAFLLLTGCFFRSVDELYAVPQAPQEYKNLQTRIQALGGEYAAPLTGEKIQAVQLQDLDGDGVQEAIAFLRNTGEEKPLKIYIFRQVEDDFRQAAVIEGTGTAINSVQYENLDDSPGLEIVVSWQMSDKLHSLAAYSVDMNQMQVVELMRTDYTDYKVYDLNRDNQKEIVVLTIDAEGGGGQAELYNYDSGALELNSAAPMSARVTGIVEDGVKTGYLRDNIPAVFVLSAIPDYGDTARVTDIFAWRNGKLENITRNPETGESSETIRFYKAVGGTDINGDSILELPQPVPIEEYKKSSTVINFWCIHWRQFDINGTAWQVCNTYYNDRDGWYLILPDGWEEKITLRRNDLTGGGERGVIFSYWDKSTGESPKDFLTIYRLSGSNKEVRADLPGRFRLRPDRDKDSNVIYAAMFMENGWNCGLDEAALKECFKLIQADWSAGI